MINLAEILLSSQSTILEAMQLIEKSDAKICLVVDSNQRLLGTVTDGDVRRGLIKHISINDAVDQIMNSKPMSALAGTSPDTIKKILKDKKVSQIPIVDENKKVVDIFLADELVQGLQKDNLVVLMAGGLGSRLGELTVETPKPMLHVGNRPILETLLENLKEHGFRNFMISVNYKAEVIENYFKDGQQFGVNITYIKEKERMGTAGSLSLLPKDIKQPLLVMNADVITKVDFSSFVDNHVKQKHMASMCVRKYDLQIPFGVVQVENGQITKLEEKPTHSYFVSAGIYVLSPSVLSLIPQNTYFDMPSLFNTIISSKKMKTGVFPIHEYWMDVGRRDDFDKAQFDFKKVF